jgi:hypothetical protein
MSPEQDGNNPVAERRRFGHPSPRSCGLISVGRQVVRSVNGGGPDGLATVGCDQAVGSPKGEAPVASATQRCKQSPTSPLRQQVRVRKPASAPGVNLVTDWTAPSKASAPREWSYVRSPTSHQGSSSREQEGSRRALDRQAASQNSERPAKNTSRRLSRKNLATSRSTPNRSAA